MKNNWSNKRILIVEDVEVNRLLLAYMLESTEAKIECAKNSKEFYALIDVNNYDLVLMDINLGETINGIDLVRYMMSKGIETPVIFQTAFNLNTFDLTDVKYNGYMTKPINSETLIMNISKIFNK